MGGGGEAIGDGIDVVGEENGNWDGMTGIETFECVPMIGIPVEVVAAAEGGGVDIDSDVMVPVFIGDGCGIILMLLLVEVVVDGGCGIRTAT